MYTKLDELKLTLSQSSDEELYRIINFDFAEYRREAIEIAKAELARRGYNELNWNTLKERVETENLTQTVDEFVICPNCGKECLPNYVVCPNCEAISSMNTKDVIGYVAISGFLVLLGMYILWGSIVRIQSGKKLFVIIVGSASTILGITGWIAIVYRQIKSRSTA